MFRTQLPVTSLGIQGHVPLTDQCVPLTDQCVPRLCSLQAVANTNPPEDTEDTGLKALKGITGVRRRKYAVHLSSMASVSFNHFCGISVPKSQESPEKKKLG